MLLVVLCSTRDRINQPIVFIVFPLGSGKNDADIRCEAWHASSIESVHY